MSGLGTYELTHPGSLSEYQLRAILKNRCIEAICYERLCKRELLEIYMRIAMPLPQRQHGHAKNLDTAMDPTPSVTTSDMTHVTYDSSADLNRGNKRPLYSQTDRLKSSINDPNSMCKKIRLCSTLKAENPCNGIIKRRCNEQNEESLTKKRQKITWP